MEPSLYLFILLSTLLLFPSLYSSQSVHHIKCIKHDQKVLLRIKQHFNNDPTVFSTWTPGTDCCKWSGVFCKKLPKTTIHRVNFLEIEGMAGTIPSDIGDLTYLENIFIRNSPNVTGNIPKSITKLANLGFINFNDNSLTGPIPNFLSKLTKLIGIQLNNNRLTGPIPLFFPQMPNLDNIELSNNQLTGTIPTNIGLRLTKLKFLTLANNKLSGPIPSSLSVLNFEILDLSGNQLTGEASFLFGENKTNLAHLMLGSNKLSFDLTNLVLPTGDTAVGILVLDLSHNKIYGRVPEWIGEARALYGLDLSYNKLCGPIPPSIGARPDSFGPQMFEHNKCLCDAPLPPCH